MNPETITDHVQFTSMVSRLSPRETLVYWRGKNLLDLENPCPEWLRELAYELCRERVRTKREKGKGQSIWMEQPQYRLFQKRNGSYDYSYLIQKV